MNIGIQTEPRSGSPLSPLSNVVFCAIFSDMECADLLRTFINQADV